MKTSKFKVLKVNQDFMTWLGIYSRDFTETSNPFFKSFGAFWILGAMTVCTIGTLIYAREFWSSDVKSSLGALKITAAGIQCFGMFLCVGVKRRQTREFHVGLQEIIDKSMNFSSQIWSKCFHSSSQIFSIASIS